MELREGEVVALLGRNGAGKSTLLKILSGQLRFHVGQVLLQGKSVLDWTLRDLSQQIAVVPQTEALPSDLTVRELVRLGRIPHCGWWRPLRSIDETAVDQALELSNLAKLQHQPIKKLSGGQIRRATLARALAQDPKILLLDEPFTGFDLEHQLATIELLRHQRSHKSLSVVMSLHDINLACMVADRIILMDSGSIIASGKPSQVITGENIQQAFSVNARVHSVASGELTVAVPRS